jgi:hypothetical protein
MILFKVAAKTNMDKILPQFRKKVKREQPFKY